jgi:hypothetical protein
LSGELIFCSCSVLIHVMAGDLLLVSGGLAEELFIRK